MSERLDPGWYGLDRLKQVFEYNLLARKITVYSRSDLAAMGAGMHHRQNFDPMNVVRRVVSEQVMQNGAAVNWYFGIVEQLLDHMSEIVCKRISMMPTNSTAQTTIIRLVREAFLDYVRKDLLQRIAELWMELLVGASVPDAPTCERSRTLPFALAPSLWCARWVALPRQLFALLLSIRSLSAVHCSGSTGAQSELHSRGHLDEERHALAPKPAGPHNS